MLALTAIPLIAWSTTCDIFLAYRLRKCYNNYCDICYNNCCNKCHNNCCNIWNLFGYFQIAHKACIINILHGILIHGGKSESMWMIFMHAQIRPCITMFKMSCDIFVANRPDKCHNKCLTTCSGTCNWKTFHLDYSECSDWSQLGVHWGLLAM